MRPPVASQAVTPRFISRRREPTRAVMWPARRAAVRNSRAKIGPSTATPWSLVLPVVRPPAGRGSPRRTAGYYGEQKHEYQPAGGGLMRAAVLMVNGLQPAFLGAYGCEWVP